MAQRTNPPWKTFVLLLLVAGAGWAVYEFAYVRRVFAGGGGGPAVIDDKKRDEIRETVVAYLDTDACFSEVGPISYRFNENSWRVDLVIRDGCESDLDDTASSVSGMLKEKYGLKVAVWCFDRGGRELGHYLP